MGQRRKVSVAAKTVLAKGASVVVKVRSSEACVDGATPWSWARTVPWCDAHQRPRAICSLELAILDLERRVAALEGRGKK